MPTVEELQSQIAELQRQLTEAKLATLPADQRPLYQRQLEFEAERAELAREREQLNQAILKNKAIELANKTHLPVSEFENFKSIAEMNDHAVSKTMEAFSNPELAKLILGQGTGTPGAGEGNPQAQAQQDPAPAAGASAEPAGSPGGGSGTQALAADPSAELLKNEHYGKGTGNLDDYLSQLRQQTPVHNIVFGGEPQPTPQPANV